MTPEASDNDEDLARSLIESGSDMAGAPAGAALGLIAGPAGVIGGAAGGIAISRVLKNVGADLRRRLLGPREELRVGAAAAFAGEAIREILDSGQQPRNDGFFETNGEDRAPAEELLEGVLLQARDAYEEKKIPFLGMLYAQFAFHAEISPPQANHLIALASDLTYRQLVLMAIMKNEGARHWLRKGDYRDDAAALGKLGLDGQGVLTEIYDLYQRGLISDARGEAWLSLPDVSPEDMRLQASGAVLATLMGLDNIPTVDRMPVYEMLQ